MRNPTPYLKMRVLGAIDMAAGNSIQVRIRAVSQMTFTDEDGHPWQFTWRTIQTWYSRYQKHGVTVMENKPRSDKGKIRKVVLEDVQEALRQVLPKAHGKNPTRTLLYRLCLEAGLLTRSQIAPNTFRRVKQYELLKPDAECANKVRLAFAKAHANELWQADTLYGPYVSIAGTPVQTRLIAFIDDASRVCCHGQFFRRKMWTPSSKRCAPPFTNAACPTRSTWTTARFTCPRRSCKSAPGWVASCITRRGAMARRRSWFHTTPD